MEERKSFTFFRSYYDALKSIDDTQVHSDLLMAICAYALDGETVPLQGVAAALFSLVKPTLDVSAKKAKAGSVGGLSRPSDSASKSEANAKQTTSKTQAKRKQTQANAKQTASEEEEDIGRGYITPTLLTESVPPTRSKKLKFAEFVSMTQAEHDSLVAKYGDATTNELVQILDNYKGSTGKTYKSDYRAILGWVTDKWNEDQQKQRKKVPYVSSNPVSASDFNDLDRMMEELRSTGMLVPPNNN